VPLCPPQFVPMLILTGADYWVYKCTVKRPVRSTADYVKRVTAPRHGAHLTTNNGIV
jgi:hypothetical protein